MASLVTGSKNMKLPKYKFIWELIKNDDIKEKSSTRTIEGELVSLNNYS